MKINNLEMIVRILSKTGTLIRTGPRSSEVSMVPFVKPDEARKFIAYFEGRRAEAMYAAWGLASPFIGLLLFVICWRGFQLETVANTVFGFSLFATLVLGVLWFKKVKEHSVEVNMEQAICEWKKQEREYKKLFGRKLWKQLRDTYSCPTSWGNNMSTIGVLVDQAEIVMNSDQSVQVREESLFAEMFDCGGYFYDVSNYEKIYHAAKLRKLAK